MVSTLIGRAGGVTVPAPLAPTDGPPINTAEVGVLPFPYAMRLAAFAFGREPTTRSRLKLAGAIGLFVGLGRKPTSLPQGTVALA